MKKIFILLTAAILIFAACTPARPQQRPTVTPQASSIFKKGSEGMPIFEYRCKSCGTVTEILQGVTIEEVPVQCSNCGGTDLAKLISTHAVGHSTPRDREHSSCCNGEKKALADCIPGSCCGRYTIGH
ncbi:MAG: zinc ribbon domain-containing protein [Firmicutes bacterium]|nr:zinc ribbon domain-containing protein [Bacillota bacterium]